MVTRDKTPIEINGENYLSIGQVADRIGKTAQMLRLWSDWSDQEEAQGKPRYIPACVRHGKLQVRYFKEADVDTIKKFSKNIPYGLLSVHSRTRWGERSEKLTSDRSLEARSENPNSNVGKKAGKRKAPKPK